MLKVNSPQPPRQEEPTDIPTPPDDNNMPTDTPMQEPDTMGNGIGEPGGEMPPAEGGENNMFDKGFDAGVDTDENEDPRNFIQQLAGKLSQSLRKYNDSLPKPDADLNKYVAGMVNSQAVKGLSEKDVETIIDRFKEDEANDVDQMPPVDGNMDSNQTPENPQGQNPDNVPQDNGNNPPQAPQDQNGQPTMESVSRYQSIDELFQDLTTSEDEEGCSEKEQPAEKGRYRLRPFTSPTFK